MSLLRHIAFEANLNEFFFLFSVIFLIIYIYTRYNRRAIQRRRRTSSKTNCDDKDIRENIVAYTDEGGEEDIKSFDMTALRIQINENSIINQCNDCVWDKTAKKPGK